MEELPLVDKVTYKTPIARNDRMCIYTKQNYKFEMRCEVKGILKRPLPEHWLKMAKTTSSDHILFSRYVNPSISQDLIDNEINFVDTVGNVFLKIKDKIYVHITGKKISKSLQSQKSKLFYQKGLQLIICILINNELVNKSIRELAGEVNISTGWTSQLFNELQVKGYLQKESKKRYRLVKRQNLFEKWLVNYSDRLRPDLFMNSYKIPPAIKNNFADKIRQISQGKYAFGGEYAAFELVRYFKPQKIDLFVKENQVEQLVKDLNLLPAKEEADLMMFDLFSDQIIFKSDNAPKNIVNPVFVYSELLHGDTERAHETAQLVYDNYIRDLIL